MVSINVANFITIGLISVVFTIALKYALGATIGKPSWL